jgi:hypothetical protein
MHQVSTYLLEVVKKSKSCKNKIIIFRFCHKVSKTSEVKTKKIFVINKKFLPGKKNKKKCIIKSVGSGRRGVAVVGWQGYGQRWKEESSAVRMVVISCQQWQY